MAITAGAAIIGGAAVSAGVAATTIAWIAVAATVVGVVTKNQTLVKIGGGLGIGGAAAGMLGLGAAQEAGSQAVASEAAQEVAEQATTTELTQQAGREVAETAAVQQVAPGLEAAIPESADALGQAAAAQQGTLQTPAATTPAPTVVEPSIAAPAAALPTSSMNIDAPSAALDQGANEMAKFARQGAGRVSDPINAVYPGSAVQEPGAGYLTKLSDWWGKLDPKVQASMLQVGGSTLAGIGQGAGSYMSQQAAIDFQREERNRRWTNQSGPAVPLLSVARNPAYSGVRK